MFFLTSVESMLDLSKSVQEHKYETQQKLL